MAAELLRRYPGVRVTATDYDDAMVAAARRRLAPFGARAEVQQADAAALPFPDASFDAALSFIMLHHVMAWEEAVTELIRVLRPGGRLLGYDLLGDRRGHRHQLGHDHRLMRSAELRQKLDALPVEAPVITPGLGGRVARFAARRAGGH